MAHYTSRAFIRRDGTAVVEEVVVIVTEHGILYPLMDYMLLRKATMSESSAAKLIQAVGLLIDFMDANHGFYDSAEALFDGFVSRLYSGTIGQDGSDPSDLYWSSRSPAVVKTIVNAITRFSDWMEKARGTRALNPWKQSTKAEERLAWAAYHHRHRRAFLGHTWHSDAAAIQMSRTRNALLKRTPAVTHDKAKHFPEDQFAKLISEGFVVRGHKKHTNLLDKINIRDVLITLLMHYGGVRVSEPFHLYVHDVMTDPLSEGETSAYVRIFHPSLGMAPDDYLDEKGKPKSVNRKAYLIEKFSMKPRDEYTQTDRLHAGWKGNMLDSTGHFMDINWFPTWAGCLFWKLWVHYLGQRLQLRCNHPFAFVTLDGKPYSVQEYVLSHRNAIQRIGLTPAKVQGTTPHAHRHAYGQRLREAGLDPIFIKKAMHHKSLESQAVYTEPDRTTVRRALNAAMTREGALSISDSLHNDNQAAFSMDSLLAYGFSDVDPLGLMSGPNPKLRRR